MTFIEHIGKKYLCCSYIGVYQSFQNHLKHFSGLIEVIKSVNYAC